MTQYFVELKYFGLHSGYICLLERDKFRLIREISMLQQQISFIRTTGRTFEGAGGGAGCGVGVPEYREAPVKGSPPCDPDDVGVTCGEAT
jgi:hypothetical protein